MAVSVKLWKKFNRRTRERGRDPGRDAGAADQASRPRVLNLLQAEPRRSAASTPALPLQIAGLLNFPITFCLHSPFFFLLLENYYRKIRNCRWRHLWTNPRLNWPLNCWRQQKSIPGCVHLMAADVEDALFWWRLICLPFGSLIMSIFEVLFEILIIFGYLNRTLSTSSGKFFLFIKII